MTAAFEPGYYVVELLGHRVRYGRVSEVTRFGESFCRIDMPTDPPTFEEYSGKALYGLRPASEESIRAYHAPRKALAASVDDYADAADSNDYAEEIASNPEEGRKLLIHADGDALCPSCDERLDGGTVVAVADDDSPDSTLWHKACAQRDAERQVSETSGLPTDEREPVLDGAT